MIDRVNNNVIERYNGVSALKQKSGSGDEFASQLEREGVVFERSDEKKKKEAAEAIRKKEADKAAAVGTSESRATTEKSKAAVSSNDGIMVNGFSGAFDGFAKIFSNLYAQIKELFLPIIEIFTEKPGDKQSAAAEAEAAEAAEAVAEETRPENADEDIYVDTFYSDEDIKKLLKAGRFEESINAITDNGRKTPARNSEVSGIYNKRGQKVRFETDSREDYILAGEDVKIAPFTKRI